MDLLAPMIAMGLVLLTLLLCLIGPALLESVATRPRVDMPGASAHVRSGGEGPPFEPHLWASRADGDEGLL